jgi:hypothetical protein
VEWMSGRGNRSTRWKLSPVPLCPPQIPHDLTWARMQVFAVPSRRLTTWATSRLSFIWWLSSLDNIVTKWSGSRVHPSDFYSGGSRFGSWPGHQIFGPRFLYVFSQSIDRHLICSRPHLSVPILAHSALSNLSTPRPMWPSLRFCSHCWVKTNV